MKKIIKITTILLCVFLWQNGFAQIASGKITYKVTKEFNTDSDYYKFYQAQYPDCFYEEFADEVEYVLEFTKEQSLFYANTENVINTSCIDKIGTIIGSMSVNSYTLYNNKKHCSYMFYRGKNLLIENTSPTWIITNETKNIQNFTCYKAYYVEKIDDISEDTEKFPKTNTHTIWFTPELSFQYGPYEYFGAPGLILEANNALGKYTYGVTKIELNVENKNLSEDINKLEKISKKITLDEFMEM